ncbi:MAG: EamA family transporter [Candidatus Riflebacteria bacterium]|nr:EamA family transporter [Candidatus Riflebacteria bacterium]
MGTDSAHTWRGLVILTLCVLLSVSAQIFLKLGVQQINGVHVGKEPVGPMLIRMAGSAWLWVGLLAYASGTLFWLAVLSEFTFHEANLYFSVNNLVVLGCAVVLFGEHITPQRWLGAALIIAGLILVGQGGTR